MRIFDQLGVTARSSRQLLASLTASGSRGGTSDNTVLEPGFWHKRTSGSPHRRFVVGAGESVLGGFGPLGPPRSFSGRDMQAGDAHHRVVVPPVARRVHPAVRVPAPYSADGSRW